MKQAGAWVLAFTCVATAEAGVVLETQIQDVNGTGVPGFVVKAVREETRVSRTAVTAEPGTAILRLPGDGVYSVSVWKPGFSTCEVRIAIEPRERRTMRFVVYPSQTVHLESESRDLSRRQSRWTNRIRVGIALGTGGYAPALTTLNQTINPAYGLPAQRADAQFAGELQVRVEPWFSMGAGLETWSSDAGAGSTFTVLVGTIPYPGAVEYRSDLSLRMFPVTARLSIPVRHLRISLVGAWVPVRGDYSLSRTDKVGPAGTENIAGQFNEGQPDYSLSAGASGPGGGSSVTRRIAAQASGSLWRFGGEIVYGVTRALEVFAGAYYVQGSLEEWKVTDYLGKGGGWQLLYRDKAGVIQPFRTELAGPVVRVGLGGRF